MKVPFKLHIDAISQDQSCDMQGYNDDFEEQYLRKIRYVCLVLGEQYIRTKLEDIRARASDIEDRPDDTDCTVDLLVSDNNKNLQLFHTGGENTHEIQKSVDTIPRQFDKYRPKYLSVVFHDSFVLFLVKKPI